MDEKELQKNIALYYSKLPPQMQETFSSMKWLENLKGITEKYNLRGKEAESAAAETTLVMLGMIHPEEYKATLRRELRMPEVRFNELFDELRISVLNSSDEEIADAFEANVRPEAKEEFQREEELDRRFAKLPEEIQNGIKELNYHATLYQIATEYDLTVPQIVDLETITTDVMLGTAKFEKFEQHIKDSLYLKEDTAKSLADDVTNKILKKVREKVMRAYNREKLPEENPDYEKKVLTSAGIEILNEAPKEPEKKEPVPEPRGDIHPLMAEKLSAPVQSQPAKTEHALDRLPKKLPSASYPKGADPYRQPLD